MKTYKENQEIIKKAYEDLGFDWEDIKDIVDSKGFIGEGELLISYLVKGLLPGEITMSEDEFYRPKSLEHLGDRTLGN